MSSKQTNRVSRIAFGLAVCAITMGGCTREKDRLDEEVRQLCAKDGGIKIYEQVSLPPNKFDEFGEVRVPAKAFMKPTDDFFYEWDKTYYRKGNPEMWRNHYKLIRRIDGKLLGEAVSYSRRGGDLPGPWHDSSFGCPEHGDIKYLNQRVFRQDINRREQ